MKRKDKFQEIAPAERAETSEEYQEGEAASTGGVEHVAGQDAKAGSTSGTDPIRPHRQEP